eukprot:5281195-Amphidinium_carterae.1
MKQPAQNSKTSHKPAIQGAIKAGLGNRGKDSKVAIDGENATSQDKHASNQQEAQCHRGAKPLNQVPAGWVGSAKVADCEQAVRWYVNGCGCGCGGCCESVDVDTVRHTLEDVNVVVMLMLRAKPGTGNDGVSVVERAAKSSETTSLRGCRRSVCSEVDVLGVDSVCGEDVDVVDVGVDVDVVDDVPGLVNGNNDDGIMDVRGV